MFKRRWLRSNWLLRRWYFYLPLSTLTLLLSGRVAVAQGETDSLVLANIWLLIAGAFVFFMNAGFAMLEAGFCRRKNATNVLAKNLIVFCVATLAYWLFGFGLMFGDGSYTCTGQEQNILSFIGQQGFFFELLFPVAGAFPTEQFSCLHLDWPERAFAPLFFFQLVFAGTAATIVSGAIAERVRFWAFVLFSFFLVGFCYPLTGHWVWGHYGWLLQALRFRDFAGSTVVHSVGGMAALVGAMLLKPRQGRFGYDTSQDRFEEEETESFTPDNLGFATLGCLILWLGWFGFNGGSTIYLEYVPHIIVTTMTAAAAGGISAILFSPIVIGKPSLSSIINGILGGLVSITASSAFVNLSSSFVIGAVGGIFVVLGEVFLEVCKIDDPVGAVPVHLFCGFWGTVAVGLFSSPSSLVYTSLPYYEHFLLQTFCQFLGWLIICTVTGILCTIAWLLIGIFIHYLIQLDAQLDRRSTAPSPSKNQAFNLSQFLLRHYQIGRQGIRVSTADELQGSDGVFYNP
ncbi:MAG: ammonium transporter [Cyanophyceae cyanobacterium]